MSSNSYSSARRSSDSVESGSRVFKILLADKISDAVQSQLVEAGHEVVSDAALHGKALTDALASLAPDVLVVRSTRVDAGAIAAHEGLQLIARAGSGVDNVDLQQAVTSGVRVANCAGANAVAVAELTWGLVLACDRCITAQDRDLKAGRWRKGFYAASTRRNGLRGRTLGVVGYGSIGQTVAKMAAAFGMKVQIWSRSLQTAPSSDVEVCSSLGELAATSDVITVHAASSGAPLLGAEFFQAVRQGAIFINTARGSVVDEEALLQALDDKQLRVGVDVYAGEPSEPDAEFASPVALHKDTVATHHVGASTSQAQDAVGAVLVEVIASFSSSGTADTMVV